jgi:hypothetical protein
VLLVEPVPTNILSVLIKHGVEAPGKLADTPVNPYPSPTNEPLNDPLRVVAEDAVLIT